MRKGDQTGRLGGLLERMVSRLGLKSRLKERLACQIWPEVVGPANARHSWPEGVSTGVLWVGTSSPAWAQELSLLQTQILQRLRERIGKGYIREIRFRQGGRRPTQPGRMGGKPTAQLPSRSELRSVRLPPDEVERVSGLLAGVSDPELAGHLLKGFLASRRICHWKLRHGWKRCPRCQRIYRGPARRCLICMPNR